VAKYKEKGCYVCGKKFIPTSPKQKYCLECKEQGRKIVDRKRDRRRSRKKHGYVEYTRNCLNCGIEFKAFYKKKVYCGAEECEKARVQIKNKRIHERRPKEYMIEKGRRYYKENVEKILVEKSIKYREVNPEAKPYVGGKPAKLTYEYVKSYTESRGYQLLSDKYINNSNPLLLKCPNGHEWETTFHNFKDGEAGCFQCYIDNNYISKFEESVREYVNKIYSGQIIYNDRTQITSTDTGRKLEFDLWFPDLNKAIECNGHYWHSSACAMRRDQVKAELCCKRGIDLLVITDKQWELETSKDMIFDFVSGV